MTKKRKLTTTRVVDDNDNSTKVKNVNENVKNLNVLNVKSSQLTSRIGQFDDWIAKIIDFVPPKMYLDEDTKEKLENKKRKKYENSQFATTKKAKQKLA